MRRIALVAPLLVGAAVCAICWPRWSATDSRTTRDASGLQSRLDTSGVSNDGHMQEADSSDRQIAGVVVDCQGAPIAGADVHFHIADVTVRSDLEGRFTSSELEPGLESLTVSKSGYAVTHADHVTGDHRVRLVLQRAGRITGRVMGPDGKPVAGAKIEARGAETTSDAEGVFEFGEVRPGEFRVWGGAELASKWEVSEGRCTWVGDTTVALAPGAHLAGVEIRLTTPKLSKVDVQFVDERGQPLSGVMVFAGVGLSTIACDSETTDSQGRWLGWFEACPGNECGVLLPALMMTGRGFRLQHPDDGSIVLRVETPRSMRLRVTDSAGNPLDNPILRLSAPGGSGEAAGDMKRTGDGSGDFIVTVDRYAGDVLYDWRVTRRGFLPAVGQTRLPPADGVLTVSLVRAGAATGRVMQPDGSPAPHTRVAIGPRIRRSKEDGRFEVIEIPAGLHEVVASSPWGRVETQVLIFAGKTACVGDLVLVEAPRVLATVTTRDGTPIGGASIGVCHGSGFRDAGWSDARGRFSVPVQDPGGVWVWVRRDGHSSDLRRVHRDSTPSFVLQEEAIIVIEFDRGIKNMDVFWPPDCPAELFGVAHYSEVRAEISLRGLPIGELELVFSPIGGEATQRTRIAVRPGETTRVKGP